MVLSSRPMEEPPKPDDSPPKDNTPPSPPEASDTNDAPPPEPENQGKLLVDATCTPADIRYPTDLSLLNEAREKTEAVIDRLHAARPGKNLKPRTYREAARRKYLSVAKKKQRSQREIRKAIRKQLGYLRRNLSTIETLAQTVSLRVLEGWLYQRLLVIGELYRQQQWMFDNKTKRIDDRIISLWLPYARPIKRGKANADTEFGAKIHVSLVRGFAFAERIDWNSFNEGTDLTAAIGNYRRRFGFFPESVHADRIYRSRANRAYCSAHGIRLSGPPLGRPPKDAEVRQEQKKLARRDEIDRIPIEGKFGQGKRRFGLSRIMAKLSATTMTVIGLNLLVMNLDKIFGMRDWKGFFFSFYRWIVKAMETLPTGKWKSVAENSLPAGHGRRGQLFLRHNNWCGQVGAIGFSA